MINIGGGFVMTNRMLGMFQRADDAPEPLLIYGLPAALVLGVYLLGQPLGWVRLCVCGVWRRRMAGSKLCVHATQKAQPERRDPSLLDGA